MRRVLMLALLALAACGDGAPDGQVVATVNGDEITRAQLNTALAAGGAAAGGKDTATVRNAVLDRLIAQQLVVQEARRQGIDKSQDYLLAMREAEDRILSDLLSRKVLGALRAPYARDIGQFVRDNPTRFARREIIAVDQIRFPAGGFDPARLNDAHDLAEVARRLTAAKIRFESGRAAIDTSGITPELLGTLNRLPAGEPFVIIQDGVTLVSTIIGRQPAPIEGDAAETLARQVIRQQDGRAALTKQLATLRRDAQIRYQPGFAAPRQPGAPAAKPATPGAAPQK